jgi:predicted RND superfamily exporter protein
LAARLVNRFLDALARLCLRHSKLVAIAALIAALIGLAGASRLTFDPDILNLIPEHNREVNEFKAVAAVGSRLRSPSLLDLSPVLRRMKSPAR